MFRRVFLCLAVVLSGCEVHEENHTNAIQQHKRNRVLALVLDTSGSFQSLLFGADGRAYQFCMEVAKDFQEEIGDDGTILLVQLSENDNPLLWEGKPQELGQQFSSHDEFGRYIRSKSSPNGSRLYGGLADTLEYLGGISGPDTSLTVLVLTDLIDNAPTQREDRKRLVEELRHFKHPKHCIGFYFLGTRELAQCKKLLSEAELDGATEAQIVKMPRRPVFAQ